LWTLTEELRKNVVPSPFYKPIKTHAFVVINSDVMAWLKRQGKGYQIRINAILRDAMIRSTHHKG
jgi:uncharacterized protein (DUF4415 family)